MIDRARDWLLLDERLDAVTRAIVAEVAPARVMLVVLFGSRARGDARLDSDYDLAVEVAFEPDDRHTLTARLRNVAKAAAPGVDFDIFLRQPGQIEARSDDPGYMEWDIARDGVVLYPHDPHSGSRRLRKADRVKEPRRPDGFASVAEWLARAAEDLRDIEKNLADGGVGASWSGVCFHSQQAAEKHLKALLIRTGIRPPRTHDLKELLTEARKAGYALSGLDADCDFLNGFAIDVRYPENAEIPSEATGRRAWEAAQRIIDAMAPFVTA